MTALLGQFINAQIFYNCASDHSMQYPDRLDLAEKDNIGLASLCDDLIKYCRMQGEKTKLIDINAEWNIALNSVNKVTVKQIKTKESIEPNLCSEKHNNCSSNLNYFTN